MTAKFLTRSAMPVVRGGINCLLDVGGKVLCLRRKRRRAREQLEMLTVEDLVLTHAVGIPVTAETDHDQTFFFGHDGLVDMPAGVEMGEDDGTHVALCCIVLVPKVWSVGTEGKFGVVGRVRLTMR